MGGLWNALLCVESEDSDSDGGRTLAAKAPSGALGVQGDGLFAAMSLVYAVSLPLS